MVLGCAGGRVRAGAELPDQPRLAHQDRPQLVGVLVYQGVTRGVGEVARHALRIACMHRQAVAGRRGGQLGERGVQHARDAVGDGGPDPGEVGGLADQRDRGHAGHHHPQRALDGPAGALADQPLPGQPDRAEDDHRRQVREEDRVAQRRDQPVDGVLQPGQDLVPRRRLVDGDRHPVHRFRRVEDHPGDVVADQRGHIGTLQAMGGPELAGDPVVVVQRIAAGRRGGRFDHRVDAAGGLLGLRQRGLADVVQAADDAARALVTQADQAADVPDARHLADPARFLRCGRGEAGGQRDRGGGGADGGRGPGRGRRRGAVGRVGRVRRRQRRRGDREQCDREQQHLDNPA